MNECKPVMTLLDPEIKLSKSQKRPIKQPLSESDWICMYFTFITSPDISHSVHNSVILIHIWKRTLKSSLMHVK